MEEAIRTGSVTERMLSHCAGVSQVHCLGGNNNNIRSITVRGSGGEQQRLLADRW